jgi:hypothetical protein
MDTPTGRVVPLEKVYGFSTRRLEPTDKVKGRKGGKGGSYFDPENESE